MSCCCSRVVVVVAAVVDIISIVVVVTTVAVTSIILSHVSHSSQSLLSTFLHVLYLALPHHPTTDEMWLSQC